MGELQLSLGNFPMTNVVSAAPTRESWLIAAAQTLEPFLTEASYPLPTVVLSVGFPKGSGKGKVVGQCFHQKHTEGKAASIFIHPALATAEAALPTLLHELLHAALFAADIKHKHGGPFAEAMERMGFEKPWTGSNASEGLVEKLKKVAVDLGPYPHPGFKAIAPDKERKQPTRMVPWVCACEEPAKIRGAKGCGLKATCNECGKPLEPVVEMGEKERE